jgi:hypothetical protein
MQNRGAALAPGILFDSDMGRNFDTAVALCMLCALGRGRVIAIGVSHSSLDAAAFCDGIARFYGTGGGLPIGLAEEGPKLESPAMVQPPAGTTRPNIRSITDTGDPPVVFRNALLTQQDMQGIVVLAGPATNVARMLDLNGARAIVASKVRLLVMGAGALAGSDVDPRIRADVAAARRVFAEWPSPIVVIGTEAGNAMPYPAMKLESDLAAIPNHPVLPALRESKPGNITTQAVLAALYASNANADYFKLSASGTMEVSNDGQTRLKEASAGKHRYLVVETAQKERITEAYVAMATAKPAAGGRGARG